MDYCVRTPVSEFFLQKHAGIYINGKKITQNNLMDLKYESISVDNLLAPVIGPIFLHIFF